jgi:glycosyltransferase involved in cell wall biosynthesis
VHVRAGFTLRQVREEIYAHTDASSFSTCVTCGAAHSNFGTRVRSFLAGWATHPSLEGIPNAISAFFRTAHYQHRISTADQLTWASGHLHEAVSGLDDLVARALDAAAQAETDAVHLKLVGYFTYPAGIGRVARWTLRTLEEAGIHPAVDHVFVNSDSYEYLSKLLRRPNPLATPTASVLCFVNADQWGSHVREPGRCDPATQHVEAVWAWELEHIPIEMDAIASSGEVEMVHALSHWSAQAMSEVFSVPVDRFAPFDMSLIESLDGQPAPCTGAGSLHRYILTTFDAKSILGRKNPEGVVAAWKRVEEDFPEHSLVIKSTDLRDIAPQRLLQLIDNSPRTVLIDEHIADDEYFGLLGNCDVYVSLHRSEGMGLTPIEAGLCGLPVVYTNYGGVAEFMQDGFFPVSYTLTNVGESEHDSGPYEKTASWAEPDPVDAERQLRRALEVSWSEKSSSLPLDRKRLEENLRTAQCEVVATAQRLIALAPPVRRSFVERPAAALDASDTQLEAPRPNTVVFALVAVAFYCYKVLPKRLRHQFNVALNKLRDDTGTGEPTREGLE